MRDTDVWSGYRENDERWARFEGTHFHLIPRLRIRGAKSPLATGLHDVLFSSAEG